MEHSLPIPSDELARRLSVTLAPRRNGLELAVDRPQFVETATGLGLRLHVTVTRHSAPEERWLVTIPVGTEDVDFSKRAPTPFVFTIRAYLEEWWDVKSQEPQFAAWGSRIG